MEDKKDIKTAGQVLQDKFLNQALKTHSKVDNGTVYSTSLSERLSHFSDEQVYQMLSSCYFNIVKNNSKREVVYDNGVDDLLRKVAMKLKYTQKKGFLFNGNVGGGKTTIALAILRLVSNLSPIQSQIYPKLSRGFITAKEYVKSTKSRIHEITDLSLEYYETCNILVIDDLGEESVDMNDWGTIKSPIIEYLSIRYDLRHNYGNFTIITTNLNEDLINERYGERQYSRLIETMEWKAFENKDYRLL